MDISIVIPLYNQLTYTRVCLESLATTVSGQVMIIVIDNGSSDGTASYLSQCTGVKIISNATNLGCAGAWNQGVKAAESEWVVILNNDVITSPGWLEGLVEFADEQGLDVVSPAIREGEYNYDILDYSRNFVRRMGSVARYGVADGICFMVRRRVFDSIGFFDEQFRIGQFEDSDFFRRAMGAGFRIGTTGRSFIHHFGSVTQKSIQKKNPNPYVLENRAYFHSKWKLSWWKRLVERRRRKIREFRWKTSEKAKHGHTLMEKWIDGRLRYF